ncbi:hypothetical protein SEA_SCAP1_43 [Streptomyces phage Scap1]|uniref:Uncharacterized protein n=1 Tax=Streptomyces phage Scap1 TaxID=2041354 RepID=A0A2D1GNQ0_9CAUD|nr:hypothetical protein FDI71_gp43 [Streptomyces phage Scap1]ATN93692.1 hypothetical protein SEA_SCAP1_43 [Streptomyces phage Scap1]
MSPRNAFEHNEEEDNRIYTTLPPAPDGQRYEWELQDDGSIKIRLVEK